MKNILTYDIEINDDPAHIYRTRTIAEFWIPELGYCFNSEGGCFKSEFPRNHANTSVPILDQDFEGYKKFTEVKEQTDFLLKEFFE